MKTMLVSLLLLPLSFAAWGSTDEAANCVWAGVPYSSNVYLCNPYNDDGSVDTGTQVLCIEKTGASGSHMSCMSNNTLPSYAQSFQGKNAYVLATYPGHGNVGIQHDHTCVTLEDGYRYCRYDGVQTSEADASCAETCVWIRDLCLGLPCPSGGWSCSDNCWFDFNRCMYKSCKLVLRPDGLPPYQP